MKRTNQSRPSFEDMRQYAIEREARLNGSLRAERLPGRSEVDRMPDDEPRLPTNVVARRLGISRRRVYDLIRCGDLRATNLGQRLIRVSEADLQEFIEGRKE